MNKKILLVSSLFVVNCLGWPGRSPKFNIGDHIEVPENRIIDNKLIFHRPLNLNDPESITHASFMDLYDEYEDSCLPTIIVRVNQGENERIYNLYSYYSWISKNPGRSPINTPIKNENYYHLKKIGEKLCLINLGDKPAISVDDMISYSCALEHEDYALWKYMVNSLSSKLIYKEPKLEAFRVIISGDTTQVKLDKLMQFIPSYSETDPFIHLLRFYCGVYNCLSNHCDRAVELFESVLSSNINKNFKAYSNYFIARSLAQLGKYEEAIKSMEDLLSSNLLNIIFQMCAKYWLGMSLSSLNRHEEAVKLLQEVLSSNKLGVHYQAYAKYYLGSSLMYLNKSEETVKILQEALSLNRLDADFQASAKYCLGMSLAELGKYKESIQPLQEAINSNKLKTSDQEHARSYLACSLSQEDRHGEVVQLLQSLNYSELSERDQAWANCMLGGSLLELCKKDEAAQVLQKVIDSNRLDESYQAEAKLWLALAILDKDAKTAKILFKEIEESGKLKNDEYLDNCRKKLTILALKENQREEADKYLTKILSSSKDGIKTRVDLGKEFINHDSESFLSTGYQLLEQARNMSEDQKTYYHEQVSPELIHALRTRVEQIKSAQKLAHIDSEVATVKSDLAELRREVRKEFAQVNSMLGAILSRLPISTEAASVSRE